MGHVGKKPYAPWGDRNAPTDCSKDGHSTADECDCDARWKWGHTDHYVDGETIAMAEIDPRLDGRCFLQQEDDPYAYVDGDDVRCPDTGEVHPEFLEILERLGLSYADVSQSGSGVHANYKGELPEGVKKGAWELDDEPWGENEDDLPTVEIYAGKRVCVATGDHAPGSPVDVREWDADELHDLLEENDQLNNRPDGQSLREKYELDDYEPNATGSGEITDDVRDIIKALDDHIDARDVAEKTIVAKWNDDASTSGDRRAFYPTWGNSNDSGTANIVDENIWQDTGDRGGYGTPVVMALIDLNELTDRNVEPSDASGEDWWKGVDHLRDLGFSIPEYVPNSGTNADKLSADELKELDVTLDTDVAWRSATVVTPHDLEHPPELQTTDDNTAWRCPHCEAEIDVVRAAALDANIIQRCSETLRDGAYDRAYNHARKGLGAPLPEYVNQETATERWDIIQGALRELSFHHLDEDRLNSTITGRGDDVTGEAELTLDPVWRDSDSGESVLVFPSGTVYDAHPDYEDTLNVLRFVALDDGFLEWQDVTDDENHLTGDSFREAYRIARGYGAPLPTWEGTDAFHNAVLPDPEQLADDDVGDDDRLAAAYDAVGDLYRDAATTDEASLLRVLPGLGKTEQVFRNADEIPALYTAGRKELMADALERSTNNGVSSYVLPVFAENGPPREVKIAAENALREEGQHLLRNKWSLVTHVQERLVDGEEIPDPTDLAENTDEDDVDLERESCPTADGWHGEEWWLAVHAARARGYRPQQIHENAAALFGAALPCTCEDDAEDGSASCEYTKGWDVATDPDAPFDVLVGHYTHAHVEGARTYQTRENGRLKKRGRAVAVDEFPGEAYQREFGPEYPDLAAWLARSLREDVDDRTDLLWGAERLWKDDTLRAWLDPDDCSELHEAVWDAFGAAHAAVDAIDTTEWLLDERPDVCSALGVTDVLGDVVDAHPQYPNDDVADFVARIRAALRANENGGADPTTLNRLEELVEQLRDVRQANGDVDGAIDAALDEASAHIDGTLDSLVTTAVDAYRTNTEEAGRTIDAARTALQGGGKGCEALAMHADDGYAHPLAHVLLYALLAPEDADDATTVRTENFTFGRDEDTRIDSVVYNTSTILADRNHAGAVVNHPPTFTAGGSDNPVVGLDATGRDLLWQLAVGREVTIRDIHESNSERREFLREVYGLQLIQTSPHANSYEGDPTGKNFDDDVELVEEIDRQYGDVVDDQPAVITTKVVENTIEDRLEPSTSEIAHYGDVKGSNALARRRLAALLGCQHYGDHVVERWAALGGEEVTRTGYGMALDYNSPVANTTLQHMREDQVMQAALRFGRDSGGALVFTHTAALRDDLPVVADGEVVKTFSKKAQAVAQAAGRLSRQPSFTTRDVAEFLDEDGPSSRTVRRVLSELADFGYLTKEETPNGVANEFSLDENPGRAEVELPEVESRVGGNEPGQDPLEVVYTWSVRVDPAEPRPAAHRGVNRARLPAPDGGGNTPTPSVPPS